jgi:succinate dehydrogenase / fumarate reductase cytochrome b subunit
MPEMKAARERPLSPHLQVYRLTLTMAMSIVHRITGTAAYFGTVIFVAWLMSAAIGPGAFDNMQAAFGSILGLLILLGLTWSLIHHALGGVRHLIWDTGRGLDPVWRERLTLATLVGSVVLTIIVFGIGLALLFSS